jgi:hypothetical protein
MAEYLNITNNDRWKKIDEMHARSDAVFGKIMAQLEILLQQYNCSPISSHGAANSHNNIPTSELLNVNLLMHGEFRSSAKQIEVPSVREQKLLQEEIDANGLAIDALPISDKTFPSMEPIDVSNSLTVALQVSKDFVPSTEPFEEQSIADDSAEVRKFTVEVGTPMCEIISNSLIRTPHLNHDVSYSFSSPFCKRITCFVETQNLALPVDLRSFTVMIPRPNQLIVKLSSQPVFIPPLPKPPDLTHNALANSPPPPKPPENVSLPTLIVLEVYPSFFISLDAQKLFDYLPHRNKITWSHTSSMYAQHSFNILGLVLFFHLLRNYSMNPTEFLLNHNIKVGIQWGGINHVLDVYDLVVKSVFVQHVCGVIFLIDSCAIHGCSNEPNLPLADHVTKTFVMWTTNSPWEKLMHDCVLWLAIDSCFNG